MNSDYPTWQDRAKAALDESSKPKPSRKPAPPTRAELLEQLRTAEAEEAAGREDALLDFYHEVMVQKQALLDIPPNF